MGPNGGAGERVGRAGRAAAGKGGVEQEEGYRRAARGCVGSVIDLQQGVSLARALSLSSSPFFSLSFFLFVSLVCARGRIFHLSRFPLSLFLSCSFSLPLTLHAVSLACSFRPSFSLFPSLHLVLAIGHSGIVRALLPFCLSPSLSLSLCLSLSPSFVNSLAAISPAVLVAQERVEPIMSPRASWLELFDPIPAVGVPRRRLLTSRPRGTLSGPRLLALLLLFAPCRARTSNARVMMIDRPTDRPR